MKINILFNAYYEIFTQPNIKNRIFSLFLFLIVTLSSKGQYIYGFANKKEKSFQFQGVEFKPQILVNNSKNSIYLTILDKSNKVVYKNEIPFSLLPNSNSISFYNSIGLLQSDKGLYLKDFLTNKEVALNRDRYNEEMPIGKFNADLSDLNFLVYDRFLNISKSYNLKYRTGEGQYWSIIYEKNDFLNNKIKLLLNFPLEDGQANYERKSETYSYSLNTNIFSPSIGLQDLKSNSENDCPNDFKEISIQNISGTARKYKAKDGHNYYQVKINVRPSPVTSKYITKITVKRTQKKENVPFGSIYKEYYINASTGLFTFDGSFETDYFEIEGFYSCETGKFSGPSAKVYFRDLKIIQ
jgi:hypothetical protein